jgi:CBS domain-containing protein
MDAVKELTSAHRIAIADFNQWHVLSQIDIAKAILKRHATVGGVMNQILKKSEIPINSFVGNVNESVTVLGAMKYMRDSKLSGIAVTDNNGKIITNFSSSDLLGMTEDKFPLLILSVREFLHRIHGFQKPPIVCQQDDTIEMLFFKMSYYNVHRIYIIDKECKLVGFVSLSDIMKFLSKVTD